MPEPLPPDSQLLFYTMVRGDEPELGVLLPQLRRHYPGATILVHFDGASSALGEALAEHYGAPHFVEKRRLYETVYGGELLHGMLERMLAYPAEAMFKIDPDCHIRRRLTQLGPTPIFGRLQAKPKMACPQGGCVGFTRASAERIVKWGGLRADGLKGPGYVKFWRSVPKRHPDPEFAGRVVAEIVKRAEQKGLVSFDWLVYLAAHHTKQRMGEHPEIGSFWRKLPADLSKFAITHPHKV
ncbi:MAG: hypothetical protein AMXMBFR7_05190 [Planctomycetota bacterium]